MFADPLADTGFVSTNRTGSQLGFETPGIFVASATTGGIQFADGSGISSANLFVHTFNGNTGDVQGLSTFAGFTGTVAPGVTTNQIIYHAGTSISGSSNFTFDGTDVNFTTDGVINTNDGGLLGKIVKDIKATETLNANDPVYISGTVGGSGRVEVGRADASDPTKMPAAGVVFSSFTTNQEGVMTILGTVRNVNTSGFTVNDTVYVGVGGGITSGRPTGTNDLIQNIGRAGRIHASTGTIIVGGAGRINDVPNVVQARFGVSIDANGITFADSSGLTTETQIAFKNEQNTFTNTNFFSNGNGLGAVGDSETSVKFENNFKVTIGDTEDAANSTKLTVDDDNGIVTVTPSLAVDANIQHVGDANTKMQFATDRIDFDAGGREGMRLTSTETQFNNGITVTGDAQINAGLSITGGGITFADGSHQNTAAERGYQYTVSSISLLDVPGSGQCVVDDTSGVVHTLKIHDTDADGNDLTSLLEYFRDYGGNIKFSTLDGKTVGQVHSDYKDTTRTFASDVLTLTLSSANLAFILEEPTVGDTLYFTIEPNDVDMVTSLGGFTGAITTSNGIQVVSPFGTPIFQQDPTFTKNTATFTISASSAIVAGEKTDALYRVPYNSTLTQLQIRSGATGGFTGSVAIAGPDFGDPTTNFIHGITLGTIGFTADSLTFDFASPTAGDFLYFNVGSNAAGATTVQAFVSFERR